MEADTLAQVHKCEHISARPRLDYVYGEGSVPHVTQRCENPNRNQGEVTGAKAQASPEARAKAEALHGSRVFSDAVLVP